MFSRIFSTSTKLINGTTLSLKIIQYLRRTANNLSGVTDITAQTPSVGNSTSTYLARTDRQTFTPYSTMNHLQLAAQILRKHGTQSRAYTTEIKTPIGSSDSNVEYTRKKILDIIMSDSSFDRGDFDDLDHDQIIDTLRDVRFFLELTQNSDNSHILELMINCCNFDFSVLNESQLNHAIAIFQTVQMSNETKRIITKLAPYIFPELFHNPDSAKALEIIMSDGNFGDNGSSFQDSNYYKLIKLSLIFGFCGVASFEIWNRITENEPLVFGRMFSLSTEVYKYYLDPLRGREGEMESLKNSIIKLFKSEYGLSEVNSGLEDDITEAVENFMRLPLHKQLLSGICVPRVSTHNSSTIMLSFYGSAMSNTGKNVELPPEIAKKIMDNQILLFQYKLSTATMKALIFSTNTKGGKVCNVETCTIGVARPTLYDKSMNVIYCESSSENPQISSKIHKRSVEKINAVVEQCIDIESTLCGNSFSEISELGSVEILKSTLLNFVINTAQSLHAESDIESVGTDSKPDTNSSKKSIILKSSSLRLLGIAADYLEMDSNTTESVTANNKLKAAKAVALQSLENSLKTYCPGDFPPKTSINVDALRSVYLILSYNEPSLDSTYTIGRDLLI